MMCELQNWKEPAIRDIMNKVNELVNKVNELETLIQSQPPKRHFRNDYGHIYEVDEFGDPIIGPPRV
jgi:hypothetical protein